jgi:hypothetical protein
VGYKYNRTKLIDVKYKTDTMNYKHKFLSLAAIAMLALASCKKTTDNVSKEVKVSFPSIALNGQPGVKLAVGAAYTDAGAKLTDDITGNISDIQPTSNNVNTAQAGVYVVEFAAANANGYETVVGRVVSVTNVTGSVDRSGAYLREATGVTCTITKVADGLYKMVNPGGAPAGVNTVVYFGEPSPGVYVCPTQPTDSGPMSVINITFTATGATWNVVNAGYGTGQRIFVKQ